jgi:hypothetical protein
MRRSKPTECDIGIQDAKLTVPLAAPVLYPALKSRPASRIATAASVLPSIFVADSD